MPGNLDSAAAIHTADYLMESLPYVVGKRAQAPVGSVVRLEVAGHAAGDRRRRGGRARSLAPRPTTASRPSRWPWTAGPSSCWRVVAAAAAAADVRAHRRHRARRACGRLARRDPVSDAWTTADIGDLTGRTAVVTGPTLGGLGFHTALELARHGARVVLAGRTPDKLAAAAEAITAEVPAASTEALVVDLSDLASVRAAGRGGRRARPAAPPGQQRRHHGAAPSAARSTGWSRRWRPTTSARSCSPGCCSTSWSRPATAAS